MFLSFLENQDGAADGAEDRGPTKPCQKQFRLDAEHGECPEGSTPKDGGPKVREQLSKGEKRPKLGQAELHCCHSFRTWSQGSCLWTLTLEFHIIFMCHEILFFFRLFSTT